MNYFLLFFFFLFFYLILPEWDWTWRIFSFSLRFSDGISGIVLFVFIYLGFFSSYFSINFHWIPVTDGIYSLEHSMHSLLRLDEITFNALISQQRTLTRVSPFWLWGCVCLAWAVWEQSLSRKHFPKAALCVVACLCAGAVGSRRGQEGVLTQFPVAGFC